MNYMKEVASLLGVQLNEEFKLINNEGQAYWRKFRITENGLTDDKDAIWSVNDLLTGKDIIQRLPFKPKYEETYWTLDYTAKNGITTVEYVWKYRAYDYLAYYNGLCFRTEEEAEANKDKLLKIINHYKEN